MHFFTPIGHPDLKRKPTPGKRRLAVQPFGIPSREADRDQRSRMNVDLPILHPKWSVIHDANGRRICRQPFITHPGR